MTAFGYARVSSPAQDLTIQLDKLKTAGCTIIRSEKVSGRKLTDRPELVNLLDFIRPKDVLIVTRLDRLARSVADLVEITNRLDAIGAELQVIDQKLDTTTPTGRLLFGVVALIAEFENDLRRERQLEGIAAAKARGVYRGASPRVDGDEIRRLHFEERLGPAAIAKKLKIGRATVYRHLPVKAAAE